MKYFLLLSATLLCSLNLFAKDIGPLPVTLEKSEFMDDYAIYVSVYHFDFNGFSYEDSGSITHVEYSIDGVTKKAEFQEDSFIEIQTVPGKHTFQFYLNDNYTEVFTGGLEIKAQYKNTYKVNLAMSTRETMYYKPVIYLYPAVETDVEVKIDIKGTHPFLYPEYNDGWKCKADPNGTLTIGEETFNYLFWEAHGKDNLGSRDMETGFVVHHTNVISFLEEKLTMAGLSTKEQADFITFWGPRMTQNDYNFVHFSFNEECDEFATLDITPKPDNIYRIYILTAPVNSDFKTEKQEITPMNRDGFTVIEWGGQQTTLEKQS